MKLDLEVRPGAGTLAQPGVRAIPKNPERLAWLVILGAFIMCIALTITVPLAARYFVLYSTESETSTLQAIGLTESGKATVRVTLPNALLPIAVTDPAALPENSIIETDQTARGFINFFDGSTAQIFPGSRLQLRELRQPRFSWSEQPNTITIDQPHGLVRYGVAQSMTHPGNPDGRPVQFVIRTPNFEVTLDAGSYSLEVTDTTSQVIVREGEARVRTLDGSHELAVGQGQRLQSQSGQTLAEPVPAAQDLILNGDFGAPTLDPAWQPYADQGGDGGSVNGSVGIVDAGERRAVEILRTGAGQNSSVTGIRQVIDRDVSDFRSLTLSADVRVHGHNLSGGGYLSSEYPLIIRIKYRDVDGNEVDWIHGFYTQNDTHNPTKDGELIPADSWVPYETSNLLEQLEPRPFRILSIAIYASGWDYESYISGVRLTGE